MNSRDVALPDSVTTFAVAQRFRSRREQLRKAAHSVWNEPRSLPTRAGETVAAAEADVAADEVEADEDPRAGAEYRPRVEHPGFFSKRTVPRDRRCGGRGFWRGDRRRHSMRVVGGSWACLVTSGATGGLIPLRGCRASAPAERSTLRPGQPVIAFDLATDAARRSGGHEMYPTAAGDGIPLCGIAAPEQQRSAARARLTGGAG